MPHHFGVGGVVHLHDRFKLEAFALFNVQPEAVTAPRLNDDFHRSLTLVIRYGAVAVQTREHVGLELKPRRNLNEVFSYSDRIVGNWHTFAMAPSDWKVLKASQLTS